MRGLLLLALLLGTARDAAAQAQLVVGRLLDDQTRQPIALAEVKLIDARGKQVSMFVTDTTGKFRLTANAQGEYRLRAERIGYQNGQTEKFKLLAADTLVMDFWLSTKAVLLAPIEVKASARDWLERYAPVGMEPFFERRTFYGKAGLGTFLGRKEVREFEGLPTTALLSSTVGVHVFNGAVTMRGNCRPQYFLNGMPFKLAPGETIDQFISPVDLEAVEIYRGASQLPGEFGGSNSECGAIVLWTRRSG